MIAEVSILARLPRRHDFFDYKIPDNLKKIGVGSLVDVIFRGRRAAGIVIGVKKNTSVAGLKSLDNLVVDNFISLGQLKLAKDIAKHYGVSLGQTLSLFAPVLPNRNFTPHGLIKNKFINKSKPASLLYTYTKLDDKITQLNKLISQVVKRKQQCLVLAYDIEHLLWLSAHFKADVWHSELKTKDQQTIWANVRAGKSRVILGTRSALFLPFANLGGIIIDDADNENYKQSEQNPRYDAVEVSRWLQTIWNCSLALFTTAPRAEDWVLANKDKWNIKTINAVKDRIIVIDQSNRPKSDSYLTPELTQAIENHLVKKQRIFLLYNRRGDNAGIMCKDCSRIARCPGCAKTLIWYQDKKLLFCHSCNRSFPIPLPCPQCGGADIVYLGSGLQDIEKQLRSLFPSIKILRIDKDNINIKSGFESQCQLVLGTNKAWPFLLTQKFDIAAVLSLDSELTQADFRAGEFAWQMLRRLLASTSGNVYVQTHNVSHVCLVMAEQTPEQFYKAILPERRQFNWPPTISILRLTTKGANEAVAKEMAQKLLAKLSAVAKSENLQISGPHADFRTKISGSFTYHIVIKYPPGFDASIVWQELPDDAIIDRHPRYVLS